MQQSNWPYWIFNNIFPFSTSFSFLHPLSSSNESLVSSKSHTSKDLAQRDLSRSLQAGEVVEEESLSSSGKQKTMGDYG